ncbi:hypothetical protein BGX38DRAFT_1272991 [Terfezia claveryi]|nr:hypothetical protein BGX38DRAFT_1272991 [Terfezia claveryi]
MKSFTTLVALTALARTGIQTTAAPNTATVAPETQELPLSQCGTAAEFNLRLGSAHQLAIPGPPDYWCCDGFTEEYHSGSGKRVCCKASDACCGVADDSVWRKPGYLKSLKPVHPDATFLKTGGNCDGACQPCTLLPRKHIESNPAQKRNIPPTPIISALDIVSPSDMPYSSLGDSSTFTSSSLTYRTQQTNIHQVKADGQRKWEMKVGGYAAIRMALEEEYSARSGIEPDRGRAPRTGLGGRSGLATPSPPTPGFAWIKNCDTSACRYVHLGGPLSQVGIEGNEEAENLAVLDSALGQVSSSPRVSRGVSDKFEGFGKADRITPGDGVGSSHPLRLYLASHGWRARSIIKESDSSASISWVRSQIDIKGNEEADKLAAFASALRKVSGQL